MHLEVACYMVHGEENPDIICSIKVFQTVLTYRANNGESRQLALKVI